MGQSRGNTLTGLSALSFLKGAQQHASRVQKMLRVWTRCPSASSRRFGSGLFLGDASAVERQERSLPPPATLPLSLYIYTFSCWMRSRARRGPSWRREHRGCSMTVPNHRSQRMRNLRAQHPPVHLTNITAYVCVPTVSADLARGLARPQPGGASRANRGSCSLFFSVFHTATSEPPSSGGRDAGRHGIGIAVSI